MISVRTGLHPSNFLIPKGDPRYPVTGSPSLLPTWGYFGSVHKNSGVHLCSDKIVRYTIQVAIKTKRGKKLIYDYIACGSRVGSRVLSRSTRSCYHLCLYFYIEKHSPAYMFFLPQTTPVNLQGLSIFMHYQISNRKVRNLERR